MRGIALTDRKIQERLDKNYSNIIFIKNLGKEYILIKQDGIEYKSKLGNLSRGKKLTIRSAVDKDFAFAHKARKVHGDKYDYSNVKYVKAKIPVEIICPKHGSFFPLPDNHLKGHGCNDCGNESQPGGWNHSDWKNLGDNAKSFDSFKLYIIECKGNNELFYKIGKTFRTIEDRFKSIIPYEWVIINTIEGDAKYISELEDKLHKLHKDVKYIPNIFFNGHTECFTEIKGGL